MGHYIEGFSEAQYIISAGVLALATAVVAQRRSIIQVSRDFFWRKLRLPVSMSLLFAKNVMSCQLFNLWMIVDLWLNGQHSAAPSRAPFMFTGLY